MSCAIKKYGNRYVNLNFVTHWLFKTYDDGWIATFVYIIGGETLIIEGYDFTEEIKRDMETFMAKEN